MYQFASGTHSALLSDCKRLFNLSFILLKLSAILASSIMPSIFCLSCCDMNASTRFAPGLLISKSPTTTQKLSGLGSSEKVLTVDKVRIGEEKLKHFGDVKVEVLEEWFFLRV